MHEVRCTGRTGAGRGTTAGEEGGRTLAEHNRVPFGFPWAELKLSDVCINQPSSRCTTWGSTPILFLPSPPLSSPVDLYHVASIKDCRIPRILPERQWRRCVINSLAVAEFIASTLFIKMNFLLFKITQTPLQKPMFFEISRFSSPPSRVLIHYLSSN